MSGAEIISEISKLSHEERREIIRCIIEMEDEAATLAECDQRALERFQVPDSMEAVARPEKPDGGLDGIYVILGERYQSGEHDVAARHSEHQP